MKTTRFTALLLSFVMVVSLMIPSAFAAEGSLKASYDKGEVTITATKLDANDSYSRISVRKADTVVGFGMGILAGTTLSAVIPVGELAEGTYEVHVFRDSDGTVAAQGSFKVSAEPGPGPGPGPDTGNQIEDGNYYVEVALWHEKKDEESMGDKAFENNRQALVTVKNGKVTKVQIATNPVNMSGIVSAITDVKVKDTTVHVISRKPITTGPRPGVTGNQYQYIQSFSFNMPSQGQPEQLSGETYVPIQFKVPDTPMGQGFMDARLKFTWSTAELTTDTDINASDEPGRGTNPETGEEVADVELIHKTTGIKLTTTTETLDADAVLEVSKPVSGKEYDAAVKAMNGVSGSWTLYKVTATLKGQEVQPSGSVTVSVPCTDKGLEVYRINASGRKIPIRGGSVKDGYYVFNTSSLGLFAIVGTVVEGKVPTRFTDVPADFWAYDAIETVVKRGLFNGSTKTTFNPQGSMTRAQFVSVLGRLAGVDANGSGKTGFADVPADMYYAPYVNWAVENGITLGVTETSFLPDRAISRQEMAVFLSRYCTAQKIDLKDGQAPAFTDAAAIGDFAKAAVAEVSAAGLLQGRNDGSFAPTATATRAHVATLMARFVEGYQL